jgi:hypothetical protein
MPGVLVFEPFACAVEPFDADKQKNSSGKRKVARLPCTLGIDRELSWKRGKTLNVKD